MKRLLLPLLVALALPTAVNAEEFNKLPPLIHTSADVSDDFSDLPIDVKEQEESLISKPTEEK